MGPVPTGARPMLSYQEALSTILQNARPLGKISVGLSEALGCALAEPIKARIPFPHFDNSAVDGFAIRFKKLPQVRDDMVFKFKGEISAGSTQKIFLRPGEAAAVFTGAPIPRGTQAVVMQEYAQRVNGSIMVQESVQNSENIRRRGEDFKKGDLLISKGTHLEPQHLALLAAIGFDKVNITRPPNVAILATGSELVSPGKNLRRAQIYDSNTPLLEALLKKLGAHPFVFSKVRDSMSGIRQIIRKGLRQDVLIICGGVSVGKYDFVKEALRREGVREIFWKINIKPGKPVFFGKKDKTLIFGLPGNPVSIYVTFEEFVKPAICNLMGKKTETRWVEGVMKKGYRNGARPHFIRVECLKQRAGYGINPLRGQGSHQIGTLARANGILKVEAHAVLRCGQRVRVKGMGRETS